MDSLFQSHDYLTLAIIAALAIACFSAIAFGLGRFFGYRRGFTDAQVKINQRLPGRILAARKDAFENGRRFERELRAKSFLS